MKKTETVYIVSENWETVGERASTVKVFNNYESAKKLFEELVIKDKTEGFSADSIADEEVKINRAEDDMEGFFLKPYIMTEQYAKDEPEKEAFILAFFEWYEEGRYNEANITITLMRHTVSNTEK